MEGTVVRRETSMTDKHTPCTCHATEHIPTPEELQDSKEFFERTGEASEPRMDIEYCPLHAAAPELLEALTGIMEAGDLHSNVLGWGIALGKARAAVRAADARTSPDHNSTPNGCEDGCPACEVEK
jgi:hypothetical protein